MMLDANLWHYLLKYKNCAIFLMIFVFCAEAISVVSADVTCRRG